MIDETRQDLEGKRWHDRGGGGDRNEHGSSRGRIRSQRSQMPVLYRYTL